MMGASGSKRRQRGYDMTELGLPIFKDYVIKENTIVRSEKGRIGRDVEVEIGDIKQADRFEPQIKAKFWKGCGIRHGSRTLTAIPGTNRNQAHHRR